MVNLKAIAVDIDGTITDSKRRLCNSAMNSIRKAEEIGNPTMIVTGNLVTYAYATEVLIGSSGGVVAENGGVIFKENVNNNEIQIIGNSTYVKKANDYLIKHYDGENPLDPANDNHYRETEVVYYKTIKKEDIVKSLEGFKYMDKVKVYDSGFALHITDINVNKGLGLKKLAKQNNIKSSEVLAIGDSENDEEFLKVAGMKVAVANAKDKLKEISDYVTKSKYGDGVSEAINKFIL